MKNNLKSLWYGVLFATVITTLFWLGFSILLNGTVISLSFLGVEDLSWNNSLSFLLAAILGIFATYPGFGTIESVHAALPKLFDWRLGNFPLKEGLIWWPIGFVGSLSIFDLKIKTMELYLDGERRITLADGTGFESAAISIQWRITGDKLYETAELNDIEKFLRENCEDSIRNSAIALSASIDRGDLKLTPQEARHYAFLIDEQGKILPETNLAIQSQLNSQINTHSASYLDFDALYVEQSLTRWKDLILYGKTKLENGRKVNLLSLLEQWRIEKRHNIVPEKGLQDIAVKYGMEIVSVTISSTKLPKEIQSAINDYRLEPTQKKREEMNAETVRTAARNLSPDGETVDSESLDRAQLEKGTKGIEVHVVRGNSGSLDKIAAGLLRKGNNGGNS